MPASSPTVSDGVYNISSVGFAPQLADLLYGYSTSTIGGFYKPDFTSTTNQWTLTNADDGSEGFTLINVNTPTYASAQINAGSQLAGDPNNAQEWIASPADGTGGYVIYTIDLSLVWTLPDGSNYTVITLQPPIDPQDNSQVWNFVSVN